MPSSKEQRLRELCERITAEHDPDKFLQLIRELDLLLAAREKEDEQPADAKKPPASSE